MPDAVLDLLSRLAGRRVLVVGDLVLDEYLIGQPGRISREAPVMVLDFTERFTRPGAACNPAANVAALHGRARLLGSIGQDEAGQALLRQLQAEAIEAEAVLAWPHQSTATKTRILAEDPMGRRQQVVRLDRLPPARIEPELLQRLTRALAEEAQTAESVLLSDYKGGAVCAETIAVACASGRPVLVDAQGDLGRFHGCTLVKANQADAEADLGRRLDTPGSLSEAGAYLVRELGAEYVVITRGGEGLSVFERGGGHSHVAGVPTQVFDATGAGDTVIAVLALGLAAGAPTAEAARLANYAASLVVRKLGAATVSPDELADFIRAA